MLRGTTISLVLRLFPFYSSHSKLSDKIIDDEARIRL